MDWATRNTSDSEVKEEVGELNVKKSTEYTCITVYVKIVSLLNALGKLQK